MSCRGNSGVNSGTAEWQLDHLSSICKLGTEWQANSQQASATGMAITKAS